MEVLLVPENTNYVIVPCCFTLDLQRNKDDWRQRYVVMQQELLVHLQLKMIRLVFIK